MVEIIIFSKGCPSCGSEQPDGNSTCSNCGNALGPSNPWPR